MQSRARWRLAAFTRPYSSLAPFFDTIHRAHRLQYSTLTDRVFESSKPRLTKRWLPAHLQLCRRRTSYTSKAFDTSTIFALSSAPGRSAIAVIRVSGPSCLQIYHALCPSKSEPVPRRATVRTLYTPGVVPSQGTILDRSALVLYFPAPHTVTGEDVLELHVHGGPAIVQAVLRAIPQCTSFEPGKASTGLITYAEPGEFTRRAFLNGKLDLTQVEALGYSLSAATEQQRRLSIHGSAGQLAKRYEIWRERLLYARGELEALIDFSEDQHFDESTSDLLASVASQVKSLIAPLQTHVSNAMRGELLRNGIQLSLLGAPNAGKSSLLNRIVGREAAIVSQEAGTTRDVVEVGIDIGGYFCRLGDTAGLRTELGSPSQASINAIEEEGMRRAKDRAANSDVVIVVLDFELTTDGPKLRLDPEVCQTAASLMQENGNVIVVVNKIDLVDELWMLEHAIIALKKTMPAIDRSNVFSISCTSDQHDAGNTIQTFLVGLTQYFDGMTAAITPSLDGVESDADPSIWQEALGATVRHRLLLEQTISSLQDFLDIAQPKAEVSSSDQHGWAIANTDDDADIVIAAEHLRDAAMCLAKITGRGEAGDVEQVLGVVFEKFCVGK